MTDEYDFRQESYPRWLHLADQHLKAANLLYDSAPQQAAFWYHQAAERYLKAYLVRRGAVFANSITNLRSLMNRCRSPDPNFEQVSRIAELDDMSTWETAFQYPPEAGAPDVAVPGEIGLFSARMICKVLRWLVTGDVHDHGKGSADETP